MDSYLKLIAVPHKLKGNCKDEKEFFLPEFKRILFKIFNYELNDEQLNDILELIHIKIRKMKDEQFRKQFVSKFVDRCINNAIIKFDLQ